MAVHLADKAGELRRLTYEDYPPPEHLFAVVSWGCAATNWFANALNDCPGIFCLHAGNFYWQHFAGASELSGVDYLNVVGMLGTAAVASGDVHGISRSDVPAIRAAFGDRFRAMVLVRDPLPRLRSQVALFDRYEATEGWDVGYLDRFFPHVIARLPTGSYRERLFLHGVNMLNSIVEEIAVGPIIRMEDITTSADALKQAVDYLTAGAVQAPEEWAQALARSRGTNRHASSSPFVLEDWQRRALWDALDPQAVELYKKLGYDFDLERV